MHCAVRTKTQTWLTCTTDSLLFVQIIARVYWKQMCVFSLKQYTEFICFSLHANALTAWTMIAKLLSRPHLSCGTRDYYVVMTKAQVWIAIVHLAHLICQSHARVRCHCHALVSITLYLLTAMLKITIVFLTIASVCFAIHFMFSYTVWRFTFVPWHITNNVYINYSTTAQSFKYQGPSSCRQILLTMYIHTFYQTVLYSQ